jgi:hypothetical protein
MDQAVEQPTLVQMEPPDFQEAWQMVASQLRMEMKRSDYETWVQALRPLGFKEGVYRLGATNSYARDWVESRLRVRISRLFASIFQQEVTVHFSLMKGGAKAVSSSRSAALPLAVIETEDEDTESEEDGEIGGQEEGETKASAENGKGKKRSGKAGGKAAGKTSGKPEAKADAPKPESAGSPRKIQLQRAYGTERARVIQPERGMFLTKYFFANWLPLLGHSAMTTVLAARSLCYWNPLNGDLRNTVETDMSELARLASVSVRTVKDVLNNELVKRYFLRYKVRRIMTINGVRTAGIRLQVRMDDPLTPEDQDIHHLAEEERWYTADFEDESEE